jgi:hypothetical protein
MSSQILLALVGLMQAGRLLWVEALRLVAWPEAAAALEAVAWPEAVAAREAASPEAFPAVSLQAVTDCSIQAWVVPIVLY